MTRVRTVGFWLLAGVLLAAHLIVVRHSLGARLWEDEAFNLTVPLNLLAGHGYTSDGTLSGSQLTAFDARISTGAAVLLPVAGVLATDIDPVIGGRLIALAYWVLLLAGLAVLGHRLAGRWAALIAVAVPLAFDTTPGVSPIQGPADVLGEIPAAALIVWALVALPRRAWLAGLLVGLAVQAKLIALLALPAFAVALWIWTPGTGGRRFAATVRRALPPLALAAVPTVLYELAALIGMRGDYIHHLRATVRFLRSGGQLVEPTTVPQKLMTLLGAWYVPWWAAAVSAALVAGLVLGGLAVCRRADAARGTDAVGGADAAGAGPHAHAAGVGPADARTALGYAAAAATGLAAYVAWWSTASHTPLWVRHPAPGVFAFVPVLVIVAVWGARMLGRSRGWRMPLSAIAMSASTVVVVAGLTAHTAASSRESGWETLETQRAAAEPLRAWAAETRTEWIAAEPWGAAVPMILLAGTHMGLSDAPAMAGAPRL
ncbi:MAG: hypothetical protein Q4G34_11135, partial [Micrococcus sp.]|nr:hypothetical protein [Micrococcus sp.]